MLLLLLHSLITASILSRLFHVFCSTLDGDDNHVCCFVSFACLFALSNRSDSTKTSFHLNSHIQTSDQDYFMCIWLRFFYTFWFQSTSSFRMPYTIISSFYPSFVLFCFFFPAMIFSHIIQAQSLNGSYICNKCSTQFSHYFYISLCHFLYSRLNRYSIECNGRKKISLSIWKTKTKKKKLKRLHSMRLIKVFRFQIDLFFLLVREYFVRMLHQQAFVSNGGRKYMCSETVS